MAIKGSRKKRAKRVVRRREGLTPNVRPTAGLVTSPTSLPPLDEDPQPSALSTLPAILPLPGATLPAWKLPDHSKVKAKALMIVALRAAGEDDTAIAEKMGISVKTIPSTLYRAGQNGWLNQDASLYDPKDRFEYRVGHKVVRNLEQALDDPDMKLRTKVALEMAEYTLQKRGDQGGPATLAPPMAIAIKIEQVNTGPVREGTVHGVGAFIEGETAE